MKKLKNVPKWLVDDKKDNYKKLEAVCGYLSGTYSSTINPNLGSFNNLVNEIKGPNVLNLAAGTPLPNHQKSELRTFLTKDLGIKGCEDSTNDSDPINENYTPPTRGQKIKGRVRVALPLAGVGVGVGFAAVIGGIAAPFYGLREAWKPTYAGWRNKLKGFGKGLKKPFTHLHNKLKNQYTNYQVSNITRNNNYKIENLKNVVPKLEAYQDSLVKQYGSEQKAEEKKKEAKERFELECKTIVEAADKYLKKKEEPKKDKKEEAVAYALLPDGRMVPITIGGSGQYSNVQGFMENMNPILAKYAPSIEDLGADYQAPGVGNLNSQLANPDYRLWDGVTLSGDLVTTALGMILASNGQNISSSALSATEQFMLVSKPEASYGDHQDDIEKLFEKLEPLLLDAAGHIARKGGEIDRLYDHFADLSKAGGPVANTYTYLADQINKVRTTATLAYSLLIVKGGVTAQSLADGIKLGGGLDGNSEKLCKLMATRLASYRRLLDGVDLTDPEIMTGLDVSDPNYNDSLGAKIEEVLTGNANLNNTKSAVREITRVFGTAANAIATCAVYGSVLKGRGFSYTQA